MRYVLKAGGETSRREVVSSEGDSRADGEEEGKERRKEKGLQVTDELMRGAGPSHISVWHVHTNLQVHASPLQLALLSTTLVHTTANARRCKFTSRLNRVHPGQIGSSQVHSIHSIRSTTRPLAAQQYKCVQTESIVLPTHIILAFDKSTTSLQNTAVHIRMPTLSTRAKDVVAKTSGEGHQAEEIARSTKSFWSLN